MIRAVIFDLDGTLVQSERLKARSYAQAAVELCPHELDETAVIEAFKAVVGRSRQEVAEYLVERFELAGKAGERLAEFGVAAPWQAFVELRLRYYQEMIRDPEVIRAHRWRHTVALLEAARAEGCRTALATMSHAPQVQQVLAALELSDRFDVVATRDDVERGKPDPEIYRLVTGKLEVAPAASLVIEDSPSGVEAALAAGAEVVAVTTPFTREALHGGGLLPAERLVDDPEALLGTVRRIFDAHH